MPALTGLGHLDQKAVQRGFVRSRLFTDFCDSLRVRWRCTEKLYAAVSWEAMFNRPIEILGAVIQVGTNDMAVLLTKRQVATTIKVP